MFKLTGPDRELQGTGHERWIAALSQDSEARLEAETSSRRWSFGGTPTSYARIFCMWEKERGSKRMGGTGVLFLVSRGGVGGAELSPRIRWLAK